ncbi:MAG: carboxypeptidase-like regulatory domain-containing protein [Rhodospirillales bacterium]
MKWRLLLALVIASAPEGAVAGLRGDGGDQPVAARNLRQAVAQLSEGVAGRLLRPGDRPLAGAVIAARSLDRPARSIPEIAITTNDDGRFQWPLRPGTYRLTAMLDGREVATVTVTVEPGRLTNIEMFSRP